MKISRLLLIATLSTATGAFAQIGPPSPLNGIGNTPSGPDAFSVLGSTQTPGQTPSSEQQELMREIGQINNSNVDMLRVLEAHLQKYPVSPQRGEIEKVLAKLAIELKDDQRTIFYGERVLATTPDDVLLLDRVARSLLTLGGEKNAERALIHASTFEGIVNSLPSADNTRDAARRQDERERGLARAVMYQSRAYTILGDKEEAERLAARVFSIYPDGESSREWSATLLRLGRDREALDRLAEAFAIPDPRVTDLDRETDREQLGVLYRKLHGSDTGLGDLVLTAYDRVIARLKARRVRLMALDPNTAATEALAFRLTGVDGSKLDLSSLKGKVVILDFWATWCVPCRTQHPLYEQVKERFRGHSDVVFLAIDNDEDRALVAPFLDEQKWSRQAVYFEDGLARLLEVTSIPTTVLFDKTGRVSSRMNGFQPETFVDQLSKRILEAILQSATTPAK